jgi:glycine cleavage system H protein
LNPDDILYAETHEWVRLEDTDGEKVAMVGITAFAVEQLVDVTYLEIQLVGTPASAGEEIGEIESVKAVSSIISPVDGEIIAVNEELANNLQLLADDPYQAGWMVKIRVQDEAAIEKLMDRAAYEAQCSEEG